MTSKRKAQTNHQQNRDKPQAGGVFQGAVVRSVSSDGMQSNDTIVALPMGNSALTIDLSQVPISRTKPQQIMAKLKIGPVDDQYEKEADRVAKQVVQRLKAPAAMERNLYDSQEVEEKVTIKEDARMMRSPIQPRRTSSEEGLRAYADFEASLNQARGSGQPVAKSVREPIEQAFGGVDFSGVRVHTGTQADQLNQSIQARAFTTGQDVFFRQGEYNPRSLGGQELIIHELTHVAQQSGGARTGTAGRSMVQRAAYPPGLANTLNYEPKAESKSEIYTTDKDDRVGFNEGFYDSFYRKLTNQLDTHEEVVATGLYGLTGQTRETLHLDHRPSWNERKRRIIEYGDAMTSRNNSTGLTESDKMLIDAGYFMLDTKTRDYKPTMYGARKYYNDIESIHPVTPGANTSAQDRAVSRAVVPGDFHHHAYLPHVLTRVKFYHSEFEKTLNQPRNQTRTGLIENPVPISTALKTYRSQLEHLENQIGRKDSAQSGGG